MGMSFLGLYWLYKGCIRKVYFTASERTLFCRQLQAIRSAGTFFQTSSEETVYWPVLTVADRRNPETRKHLGTCISGDAQIRTMCLILDSFLVPWNVAEDVGVLYHACLSVLSPSRGALLGQETHKLGPSLPS